MNVRSDAMAARPSVTASWLRVLGWTAVSLFVLGELAFLFKSSTLTLLDSDYVENVLEASDILRGNVLLHGWILDWPNYYLSTNPFYLVTNLLFGRTLLAIYAGPFLIYLLLLGTAAGIVWLAEPGNGRRAIGLGVLVFYLATPDLSGLGPVLFGGGQHIATFAFGLLAWLALDAIERAGSFRDARGMHVLYGVSVFVALFSDPFGNVVFLVPTLIALIFALLAPNRRLLQGELIILTLLLFGAARFGASAVGMVGGFTTVANTSFEFVGAEQLGTNAAAVLFGLLTLSEGNVFGHTIESVVTLFALVRGLGLLLMLAAMAMALRRGLAGTEGWNLRFALALAMLLDLCACLVSLAFFATTHSPVLTGGYRIHYLTPAILFGGVLVALELPRMLQGVAPGAPRRFFTGLCGTAVAAAVAIFIADGIGRWNQEPVMAQSPGAVAGQWLLSHGLTHGVGTYWEGMLITSLTGEKVTVAAVIADNGKLGPFNWITNQSWYRERPTFAIYTPNNRFGVTAQTIAATYGPPIAIAHVDGYDVALLSASTR
jgi:hypothetical protein